MKNLPIFMAGEYPTPNGPVPRGYANAQVDKTQRLKKEDLPGVAILVDFAEPCPLAELLIVGHLVILEFSTRAEKRVGNRERSVHG